MARYGLWAKSDRANPENFHPVLCHLIDVAAVAWVFWRVVLQENHRRRVAGAFGLDVDSVGRLIAYWAGSHDIGKVSPGFQSKRPTARKLLRAAGFDFPYMPSPPRHGAITTNVLLSLRGDGSDIPRLSKMLTRPIAIMIGGHHGYFPSSSEFENLGITACGAGVWDGARREMLSQLAQVTQVVHLSVPRHPPIEQQAVFYFLAGLISVADWIGSNQDYFPYTPDSWTVPEYARKSLEQATRALHSLGWTRGSPKTSAPRTFAQLFPSIAQPRPLQLAVMDLLPTLTAASLVLIEDLTGEGKTEAAFCHADYLTHALGQRGLYVALPTQATSNQMFQRVASFLAQRYPSDRINLHLLHSHAALSERYQSLQMAAIDDEDSLPGAVVADGWFAQRKIQALLAPFGVGTIDQAMLAVLQTRHVCVRLFGLAGKTVILDEIHAYDAYMSTILERLLQWLAALGSSVVLLSATLPAAKRQKLLEAYAGKPVDLPKVGYPRISIVDAGRLQVIPLTTSPDRRSSMEWCWKRPEAVAGDLQVALRDGGCAAVICNTVHKAQTTYLELKEKLVPQGIEVELFHARYLFGRRQQIELDVLRRYGKPAESTGHRPARSVLVATQVIEQSLDLDFDLMVSDVAPADLLLQRAGRLHRHQRPRPAPLAQRTLWLVDPTLNTRGFPDFGRSDEMIYERYVLLRSYLVFRNRSRLQLPDDLESLIEGVYSDPSTSLAEDTAWKTELMAEWEKLSSQDSDRQNAQSVILPPPNNEDGLLEVRNEQLNEDNPEIHPQLQAKTRLTRPSVSLICLYELDGKSWLRPDRSGPPNPHVSPSPAMVRELLNNELSVTTPGLVHYFVPRGGEPAWKNNSMLCYSRLLQLDADGKAQAGGYHILVDDELGLRIDDLSTGKDSNDQ